LHALPDTTEALVLRTDFSDEAAWESLCQELVAPNPVEGFQAYLQFVSDRAFEGLGVDELLRLPRGQTYRSFFFVVDRTALTHPEHPVLVIDLMEEPGRAFRVVPREMWAVENNLSIANMDFEGFAENADADGIFRGFPAQ
jgi:hypothetical protein